MLTLKMTEAAVTGKKKGQVEKNALKGDDNPQTGGRTEAERKKYGTISILFYFLTRPILEHGNAV